MKHSGYTLPIIVVLSFGIIVILLGLLQLSSSLHTMSYKNYYVKLSEEAGEAGLSYANTCLELNDRVQTWGPAAAKPDLRPSTDCFGAANAYPNNNYVLKTANVRSYFIVGNLDSNDENGSQISAIGVVEQYSPATGLTTKTYQTTMKKLIRWSGDLEGEKSVSGTYRTCAILSAKVYCWGQNDAGQLGNGTTVDSNEPVRVTLEIGGLAGKKVVDMFTAQWHNCALTDEGEVYCWGLNSSGQLGDNTTTNRSKPVKVGGALAGKTVTAIGGTYDTSCAIAEGKIYCWGSNENGVIGNNTATANFRQPVLVATPAVAGALPSNYFASKLSEAGSRSHNMCAIVSGKAYCWGQNQAGQIGNNTQHATDDVRYPTKVFDGGALAGKSIVKIAQDGYFALLPFDHGGYTHVCAYTSDNKVYCWGDNSYGQLGNGTTDDALVPTPIYTAGALAGKTVKGVAVGVHHTCAYTSDNNVYCWGKNHKGQLGRNFFSGYYDDYPTPQPVYENAEGIANKTIVSISGGANRGCVIASTPTSGRRTYCWGLNNKGQIGDGTVVDRAKPTEAYFLRPRYYQYIY